MLHRPELVIARGVEFTQDQLTDDEADDEGDDEGDDEAEGAGVA